MKRALTTSFFNRPTLLVAEELIGKFLIRESNNTIKSYLITEVEAYDGPKDKASHASRGMTPRNTVMFGESGVFYVYLCYGMHHMLNIVTGPQNYPAAILIRGVEGASGPGRVTKLLGINKNLNEKKATTKTGYWFEDRGVVVAKKEIQRTPRVGVAYAGPVWANKKYRFVLKTNRGSHQ